MARKVEFGCRLKQLPEVVSAAPFFLGEQKAKGGPSRRDALVVVEDFLFKE